MPKLKELFQAFETALSVPSDAYRAMRLTTSLYTTYSLMPMAATKQDAINGKGANRHTKNVQASVRRVEENMKNYIPKTKDDLKAVEYLKSCKFSEVEEDAPLLLTYMQDLHWDVAHGIGEFFSPYVNELKPVLLNILNSNDLEWKFGIVRDLIARSSVKLDADLLQTLKRIAFSPAFEEVSEELDLVAQQIVANNS